MSIKIAAETLTIRDPDKAARPAMVVSVVMCYNDFQI